MSVLALITEPDWLSTLQRYGWTEEVNFWRPGAIRLSAQHLGSAVVFVKKGTEPRKVLGYGVINRVEELKIEQAWETWGTNNGVTSLSSFIEEFASITEQDAINKVSSEKASLRAKERIVECIALTEVHLFAEALAPTTDEAFAKLGELNKHTGSYKVYPNASLWDVFSGVLERSMVIQGQREITQASWGKDLTHGEKVAIELRVTKLLHEVFSRFKICEAVIAEKVQSILSINNPSYDYGVISPGSELHIVGKGTKSTKGTISITGDELLIAHVDPLAYLFVVSGISTNKRNGVWEAEGGVQRLYRWRNLTDLAEWILKARTGGLGFSGDWVIDSPETCEFLSSVSIEEILMGESRQLKLDFGL